MTDRLDEGRRTAADLRLSEPRKEGPSGQITGEVPGSLSQSLQRKQVTSFRHRDRNTRKTLGLFFSGRSNFSSFTSQFGFLHKNG